MHVRSVILSSLEITLILSMSLFLKYGPSISVVDGRQWFWWLGTEDIPGFCRFDFLSCLVIWSFHPGCLTIAQLLLSKPTVVNFTSPVFFFFVHKNTPQKAGSRSIPGPPLSSVLMESLLTSDLFIVWSFKKLSWRVGATICIVSFFTLWLFFEFKHVHFCCSNTDFIITNSV